MKKGDVILIRCKVEHGAFSGERLANFSSVQPDESNHLCIPADYCFDAELKPFDKDQPPRGELVAGFMTAVVRGFDTEHPFSVLVEIPMGDLRWVRREIVAYIKFVETRWHPVECSPSPDVFPPIATDQSGRIIPISDEEWAMRHAAMVRVFERIEKGDL